MQIDTLSNGQIRVSYPELMKNETTIDELLKYYPIGDTVVISLSGEKGLFKKYVSIPSTAKIIEHKENKLIVEIISMIKDLKVNTKYKIGDKIDIKPFYCRLIPPKDWNKKK